jgi:predicted dehydrogenase
MVHRIGLLGASKIARVAVIAPAASNPDFEIVAVGARDAARARAYADEHGIAHVAGSYAELVARDDVDVVYNPLRPQVTPSGRSPRWKPARRCCARSRSPGTPARRAP